MNLGFKFKQFYIAHDKCAMKVGTDAVLLGCSVPLHNSQHILDIGTGTGILAMMIAQRQPNAYIDAVEIDEQAANQAGENFNASPFKDRLNIYHTCIRQFLNHQYDLIVSNPPFYAPNLQITYTNRKLARTTSAITHKELVDLSTNLLRPNGLLYLILPILEAEVLLKLLMPELPSLITFSTQIVDSYHAQMSPIWALRELVFIQPVPSKIPNRVIIGLQKNQHSVDLKVNDDEIAPLYIKVDRLVIRDNDGRYTQQMKTLTTDFMLKH